MLCKPNFTLREHGEKKCAVRTKATSSRRMPSGVPIEDAQGLNLFGAVRFPLKG